MNPDIDSLMAGSRRGKQALLGNIPSSTNVGGAPPGNLDPLKPRFAMTHSQLMSLAAQLHQMRDEKNSNMIVKLATQLQSIALERGRKAAESQDASNPASAAPANAMGTPGGQ